jgi:hypothetical protein
MNKKEINNILNEKGGKRGLHFKWKKTIRKQG